MNIEIPKKFKPLINNAYQVAQSTQIGRAHV